MIEIKTTYNCLPIWHVPQYFRSLEINFRHTEVRINGVIFKDHSPAYLAAVHTEYEKRRVWRKLND
jgi:hypothetical protein